MRPSTRKANPQSIIPSESGCGKLYLSHLTKSMYQELEPQERYEINGPVDRLLAFKAERSGRIHGIFNQTSTTSLSPSRITINESSLLQSLGFVSQEELYADITQKSTDFFDALRECVRSKSFPPGSVLPKIASPSTQKGQTETSYVSSLPRKSRRKPNFKPSRINSQEPKIYRDPYKHAAILKKQLERRQKAEELHFMKELEALQKYILRDEKRLEKHRKDIKCAYRNAIKLANIDRRRLRKDHQLRRNADASDMIQKVKIEKTKLETKRLECAADRDHQKRLLAEKKKREWQIRKKEREERERVESERREIIEREKRREWEIHRANEQNKAERAQRERERHEAILRQKRREQKLQISTD